MKKLFILAMMVSLASVSHKAQAQEEHEKFGIITFATDSVWVVGEQTWSDAVQCTKCNKTLFFENADCRSNPDYKGDLFLWDAINEYKDVLCPNGWRVPTKDDFVNLDKALGGTGNNNLNNLTLRNNYLNSWGGVYGGYSSSCGTLYNQGSYANYWSQSEYSSDNGYYLLFGTNGTILPQYNNSKDHGFTLRCVR